MNRRPSKETPGDAFAKVMAVGLTLPNVQVPTRYDGSPMLKVGGGFMAGLVTHPSADEDYAQAVDRWIPGRKYREAE